MHADEEGPDVQGGLVAIRSQELQVILHAEFAHLDEHFLRGARHTEIIGGPGHPGGVLIRPEKGDAPVFLAKSLQSFKTGDRVVEDLGERIECERKGLGLLDRGPLAVFVMGQDDGTSPVGIEAQGIPVDGS